MARSSRLEQLLRCPATVISLLQGAAPTFRIAIFGGGDSGGASNWSPGLGAPYAMPAVRLGAPVSQQPTYGENRMRKLLLTAVLLLPLNALAAIQVSLVPSQVSAPVGDPIDLVTTASDSNPGILSYRYTISHAGTSRIVQDFSQSANFSLAGIMVDGSYVAQVTVRNNSTLETAIQSVRVLFTSRIHFGLPNVSDGGIPMVALFSAPACPSGSKMRVWFSSLRSGPDTTDWRPCNPYSSMNFYIAGLRQNTIYTMAADVSSRGRVMRGPLVNYRVGSTSAVLPTITPVVPTDSQSSLKDDVLLTDFISTGSSGVPPIATDLQGNVIWYYPAFGAPGVAGALLSRVVPGGTMLVLANGRNSSTTTTLLQILREIDLNGNALRETNATRVREQLDTMGLVSSCESGGSVCASGQFHHDAIRLPNGHTLVLGTEERMYPAGTQGSPTPVDILGDVVVDLDENFQVVWYWDAFDHLDVNRAAPLGETCTAAGPGCPSLFLAPVANDWLHANTIQYTSDHNLIVSLRHQDWVIKVDYADGQGTGDVIWRLGVDGDFAIASTDPWPWFSHQHDAGFEANGTFTVFDNGNTRVAENPGSTENSRGQAYQIDEINMVATPFLSADLGLYSSALGSAQLLSNGNHHYLAGFVDPGPTQFSQSIEVLPDGTTNLRMQTPVLAYRSFRMKSLYAPPGT